MFEDLLASKDSACRGRAFDHLLCQRLALESSAVHLNPKAAKPRQTDLIATFGSQDYLIEAKWRKRNVNVGDIGNLRDRLRRTPSDFVGCIFNMSDFAATAIEDVESDRTREILLFNAGEINSIFVGRASIQELIKRKREALRIQGKVLFLDSTADLQPSTSQFPPPSQEFRVAERAVPYVSFPRHRDDSTFLLEIPDIGAFETFASLGLRLSVVKPSELADVFALIQRTIGLSRNGCFSIHQLSHSWHGLGIREFLEAIGNWKQRYTDAKLQSPHHSEELVYIDPSGGTLISVTSQQRIGDSVFLHGSELEIQLAGIPVDLSGLHELCKRTGNEKALIRMNTGKSLHSAHLHGERVKLAPIAKIITIDRGQKWVSGIVAKNPFNAQRMKRFASEFDEFFLRNLTRPEYLICDMPHQYLNADEVTEPFIREIYGVWAGHVPVLNVRCTWDNYIRRTEDTRDDFEALLKEIPDVIDEDDEEIG